MRNILRNYWLTYLQMQWDGQEQPARDRDKIPHSRLQSLWSDIQIYTYRICSAVRISTNNVATTIYLSSAGNNFILLHQ